MALATALIGALAWWSQRIGEPVVQPAVSTATAPASSAEAASETAPGALPVSGPTEAGASDATAGLDSPVTAAADASTEASTTPPSSTPPSSTPSSATPPSAASPASATASPVSLEASRRWLSELPAQTWVVEHSRHSSLSQARRSTSGRQHLREARIVPIRHKGQTQYLVITGPFRSAERAETYLQRLQVKGRVHKTRQLRSQIAR